MDLLFCGFRAADLDFINGMGEEIPNGSDPGSIGIAEADFGVLQ